MTFEKDGIIYTAGRGYAFAKKKSGEKLWSAMDVFKDGDFKNREPTQGEVLQLKEFFLMTEERFPEKEKAVKK